MRAAHDVGGAGCVVAGALELGVAAVVVVGLVGAALVVVTVGRLVAAEFAAVVVVTPSVAVPVEHAATSDVRTRATGRAARDGIRLGIPRP
jgi:hypothetical protein